MEQLYRELEERLKELEQEKITSYLIGRKRELTLVIVRVQQLLLEKISTK